MHHAKRSQQPLNADQSGHAFFPQSSIAKDQILTQGGLTAHDRKYKTSSLAVIRCPMLKTCQTDMDFAGSTTAPWPYV